MNFYGQLLVRKRWIKLCAVVLMCLATTGCIGTVVGAVVDTAVEVIKVPFKVGGAVIDAVTPDDLSEHNDRHDRSEDEDQEAAAVRMEQEGI